MWLTHRVRSSGKFASTHDSLTGKFGWLARGDPHIGVPQIPCGGARVQIDLDYSVSSTSPPPITSMTDALGRRDAHHQ
jgi:hypothetical protein